MAIAIAEKLNKILCIKLKYEKKKKFIVVVVVTPFPLFKIIRTPAFIKFVHRIADSMCSIRTGRIIINFTPIWG